MLHLLLKKDKTFVENYRPVSALPTVSKIFEQIMQKQITDYLGKILSPFLCEKRIQYTVFFVIINREEEIVPR